MPVCLQLEQGQHECRQSSQDIECKSPLGQGKWNKYKQEVSANVQRETDTVTPLNKCCISSKFPPGSLTTMLKDRIMEGR